jgi:hypothetical protein
MPADGATGANPHDHAPQDLIHDALPALLAAQRRLESAQRATHQVDGTIIGTGHADFTKSNHIYDMPYDETSFQLVDVPGIEGNEANYETMIHDAIAKAHLVFYVNGSNKKPEVETAKRIKFYLRRDAAVYAITNMRGRADKYESPGECETLEQSHQDCRATVEQTRAVLEAILGTNLQDCFAVQGGVGFSSVAYDVQGQSSIVPARKDLLRAQKSYRACFSTAQEMRRFSRIGLIEQIIAVRVRNHKAEIIEANKRKAIALMKTTIETLEAHQKLHAALMEEIAREIAACKTTISTEFTAFKNMLGGAAIAAVGRVFTKLQEVANKAVDSHFDDKEAIIKVIKIYLEAEENLLQPALEKILLERISELMSQVATAIQRMVDRVARLEDALKFTHDFDVSFDVSTILNSLGFGLKEWQKMGEKMLRFAGTGFLLGDVFPVIGNVIGAVVGALLALVIYVGKWFVMDRDAKIAETKANIGVKIGAKWDEVKDTLRAQLQEVYAQVNNHLEEGVVALLDDEAVQLNNAGDILGGQLHRLRILKKGLEAKAYEKF